MKFWIRKEWSTRKLKIHYLIKNYLKLSRQKTNKQNFAHLGQTLQICKLETINLKGHIKNLKVVASVSVWVAVEKILQGLRNLEHLKWKDNIIRSIKGVNQIKP